MSAVHDETKRKRSDEEGEQPDSKRPRVPIGGVSINSISLQAQAVEHRSILEAQTFFMYKVGEQLFDVGLADAYSL